MNLASSSCHDSPTSDSDQESLEGFEIDRPPSNGSSIRWDSSVKNNYPVQKLSVSRTVIQDTTTPGPKQSYVIGRIQPTTIEEIPNSATPKPITLDSDSDDQESDSDSDSPGQVAFESRMKNRFEPNSEIAKLMRDGHTTLLNRSDRPARSKNKADWTQAPSHESRIMFLQDVGSEELEAALQNSSISQDTSLSGSSLESLSDEELKNSNWLTGQQSITSFYKRQQQQQQQQHWQQQQQTKSSDVQNLIASRAIQRADRIKTGIEIPQAPPTPPNNSDADMEQPPLGQLGAQAEQQARHKEDLADFYYLSTNADSNHDCDCEQLSFNGMCTRCFQCLSCCNCQEQHENMVSLMQYQGQDMDFRQVAR